MARPQISISAHEIEQIKILAGFGLSEAKIARAIGLSPKTLQRRKRMNQQVLDAIETGKAIAEAAVSRSLYNLAIAGNVPAIIWYEKTRCGRHDRSEIEVMRVVEQQLEQTLNALEAVMPHGEYEQLLTYLSAIDKS